MRYVNNTDINFADIGTTIQDIVNEYITTGKIPEAFEDMIVIDSGPDYYRIDWA